MMDFLFVGNWGRFPKWLFYLLIGWLIFACKEWNTTSDVISLSSWYWGAGGTLLAGFSLYLTSESPYK